MEIIQSQRILKEIAKHVYGRKINSPIFLQQQFKNKKLLRKYLISRKICDNILYKLKNEEKDRAYKVKLTES